MKTFSQIASESFGIPEGQIIDTLSSHDVPNWDSMNYLLFISELEKHFNVSFTMDEVLDAQSLGDIKEALRKKGIAL